MIQHEGYAEVDRLKAELDALRPLRIEDADRLWKKLRLEWNFNSNHIEGNTLTYGETELLLIFDRTTGDHTKREYDEMQAHDVAVHMVREWAQDNERELTESSIRELNRIILVKPYYKEAITYDGQPTRRQITVGEYKKHPNSVRLPNGEMFHYVDPMDVPQRMEELMNWIRTSEAHPIELAADFHYKLIRIHPFDDGNGRVARLLTNYILMSHGHSPIIIYTGEKSKYITALQKADAGDMQPFRAYIRDCCITTTQLSIRAANGEIIEDDDDIDKEISLFKAEVKAAQVVGMVKKTHQVVAEYYFKYFKSMFELFEAKHHELDDLFMENKYRKMTDNGYTTDYKDNQLEELIKRTLNTPPPPSYAEKTIGTLAYAVSRKGFKSKGLDMFDEHQTLTIKLDDYQFFIGQGSTVLKRYTYTDKLNDGEMKSIVNALVRKHLEEIKAKASSGTKKK